MTLYVIVGKYIIFKAHLLLILSVTMCTSWYFPLYVTPTLQSHGPVDH